MCSATWKHVETCGKTSHAVSPCSPGLRHRSHFQGLPSLVHAPQQIGVQMSLGGRRCGDPDSDSKWQRQTCQRVVRSTAGRILTNDAFTGGGWVCIFEDFTDNQKNSGSMGLHLDRLIHRLNSLHYTLSLLLPLVVLRPVCLLVVEQQNVAIVTLC